MPTKHGLGFGDDLMRRLAPLFVVLAAVLSGCAPVVPTATPHPVTVPHVTGPHIGVQGLAPSSPIMNDVLSTTNGTWSGSPDPTFTYQWQRCNPWCSNIGGATSSTYALAAGDVGETIDVVVAATNSEGSATATSGQTGMVLAARFYVDSVSGSNSNDGTSPETAWQTLAKVNATTFTAGQVLAFKGGQSFSGEFDPLGSGASGSPITVTSYGTGKATITTNSGVALWLDTNNWWQIQRLILDGQSTQSCVASGSGGAATNIVLEDLEIKDCTIGINQARASDANWTIQNDYIHDTTDSGIALGGPSHTANGGGFVVKNSRIENVGSHDGSCGMTYGAHGIYDDSPGLVVQNNDIGNFSCDGGQAVSVRYGNALIEGNTIHDGPMGIAYINYDASETDGHGTSIIRYNRIWDMCSSCSAGYGIDIDNEAGAGLPSPDNWQIYNNTIASPNGRGYAIALASDAGTSDLVQNNNMSGRWGLGQYTAVSDSGAITENHNDWGALGGSAGGGSNDVTNPPNLSAAPDLVPQAGSPVINAGTTSVTGATFTNLCNGTILDYCGSAPDMGAVEVG